LLEKKAEGIKPVADYIQLHFILPSLPRVGGQGEKGGTGQWHSATTEKTLPVAHFLLVLSIIHQKLKYFWKPILWCILTLIC